MAEEVNKEERVILTEEKDNIGNEIRKDNESLKDKVVELDREIGILKNLKDSQKEEIYQLKRENERLRNESVTRLKDKYEKLIGVTKLLMGYAFEEKVLVQDLVPKSHEDRLREFEMI